MPLFERKKKLQLNMFILVSAKPGLVKKRSPGVRTGSADEREQSACAGVAFKWKTNLFGSEVHI